MRLIQAEVVEELARFAEDRVTPAELATAQLRDVMCTFSCRRMLLEIP